MANFSPDATPIGIRCPKCGQRHEKPLAWVRANSTMQCAGCGVTIRLDQKRLPVPPPAEHWWRNPRHLPWIVGPPVVALIAIVAYVNVFRQSVPGPIPTPAAQIASNVAPRCSVQPANGQVLADYGGTPGISHSLQIDNGSAGNAIVKVRNAVTGRVVVSFFVAANHAAAFDHLGDGAYRIQYALGTDLAESCAAFIQPLAAKEFPEVETLVTARTRTEIIWQKLRFTLYAVPSGNVLPRAIDIREFNAE